jgi:hypothetical protein
MNKKQFICAILLIGSLFLIGCDKNTIYPWDSETIKLEKASAKTKTFSDMLTSLEMQENKEYSVLLSYKYDIQEETIQSILKDYIKETSELINLANIKLGKSTDYREFINKLSVQYNITKEKLASMIIDYKILTKEFTILEQ